MVENNNCYLYELKYEIFYRLVNILNNNGLWEILVLEFLRHKYTETDIRRLRKSPDPSSSVLSELKQRCYTVKDLVDIFLHYRVEEPLMLFCNHVSPVIEVQPPRTLTLFVGVDTSLRIEFKSSGFPFPKHVWFKYSSDGKPELVPKNPSKEPYLDIPLSKDLEGTYFCQLYNENNENQLFSKRTDDVYVTVIDHSMDIKHKSNNCIRITKQPESPADSLRIGSSITLKIKAQGENLQYQWFEDNKSVLNGNSPDLTLDNLGLKTSPGKTSWNYHCCVNNSTESVLSEIVTVTVDPTTAKKNFEASDKIAILFGNQLYANMSPLFAAKSDVRTLAKYFLKHDFKVFCFYNTDFEMMNQIIDNICRIFVDEGVYVVFYFGGHGIEVNNQCYMMPTDVSPGKTDYACDPLPDETEPVHKEIGTLPDESVKLVCAYDVLWKLQSKNPAVVVMILDMCRNKPSNESYGKNLRTSELEYHPNTLIAYATTPKSPAFENKGSANGIYVSHLKHILEKDLTIAETFSEVKQSVRRDPKFKEHEETQIPWNSGNLSENFRFSDQIKTPKTPPMTYRDNIYSKLTTPLSNVGFKREISTDSGLLKLTFQIIPNSTNLFQNEFEAVTLTSIDRQCDIDFETSIHSFDEQAKCWKTAIDIYPEQTITKHTIWLKSFDVRSLWLYIETRFNEISCRTAEKIDLPNMQLASKFSLVEDAVDTDPKNSL